MKKHKKLLWIFILILTFIRIGIATKIPISANGDMIHDDQLLVEYAKSLLCGQWLGNYTNRTLVKGISFPVFLCICKSLFIPYTVGLAFLNIGSAVVFLQSVKDRVKSYKVRIVIYILMIYSPVGFAQYITQQLYRMAIVPYVVILVISCIIGLYLRRYENIKKMLPWSIGAGISLSFFWFIREDSMWILPFVIVVLAVTAITMILIQKVNRNSLIKVFLVALPLLVLVATNLGISSINYHYYGIFTTNDRSKTEFGKMMSNLYKIDDPKASDDVWVSYEVLNKAMQASPTLASIEYELRTSITAWCGGNDNAELKGDIIAWAIRDAADLAGYYKSAQTANTFYSNINNELEKAFVEGKLVEDDLIHFTSQSNGIEVCEIWDYVGKTFKMLAMESVYEQTGLAKDIWGSGGWSNIRNMEALTGSLVLYPSSQTYKLEGWIFTKQNDSELSVEVIDENNNHLAYLGFFDSPDVYQTYPQYTNAKKARFSLTIPDLPLDKTILLNIFINGNYVETIKPEIIETNSYMAWFTCTQEIFEDTFSIYSDNAIDTANFIVKIYKALAPLTVGLFIISYILLTVFLTKHLTHLKLYACYRDLWLIITGLILTSIVLTFGVVFFCSWLTDTTVYVTKYSAATYSMLQIAKYISIYSAVCIIYSYSNKNTNNVDSKKVNSNVEVN